MLEGWLIETNLSLGQRNTIFARHEGIEASELFERPDPLHDENFTVSKSSVGYAYTLPVGRTVEVDLGAMASRYAYSSQLEPAYGPAGLKIDHALHAGTARSLAPQMKIMAPKVGTIDNSRRRKKHARN